MPFRRRIDHFDHKTTEERIFSKEQVEFREWFNETQAELNEDRQAGENFGSDEKTWTNFGYPSEILGWVSTGKRKNAAPMAP